MIKLICNGNRRSGTLYKECLRLEEENYRLRDILNTKQIYEQWLCNCRITALNYLRDRLFEFKNAGKSRKDIKAHHYYMIIQDLLNILQNGSEKDDK